jgi:hypothetical protein
MNVRKTGLTVLMVLLIGALFVSCSDSDKKKVTGPVALPPEVVEEVVTVSSFTLRGNIVDESSDPVASAKVRLISGEDSDLAYTDDGGTYVFSDISIGQYIVTSEKAGYTFTTTNATVTENGVSVKTMTLKNMDQIENRAEEVTTAAEIKASGIEVKSEYQEEVSTGTGTTSKTQEVTASVPPNTEVTINGVVAEETIVLSAAPMKMDEIPQAEEDELPLSAVVLEPQGAEFSEPVEVTMPMGIQLPAGTKIPVKKLENGEWVDAGEAEIGAAGANMDVTEFGQYSIQVTVETETTEDLDPVTEVAAAIEIPEEQTSVELEATDTIEFSEPLPEGLSPSYIQSLIEKQSGTSFGVAKSVSISSPTKTVEAQQAAKVAGELFDTWTVQLQTITSNNVFIYAFDYDGDGINDFEISIPYTIVEEFWEAVITFTTVIWWVDVTVADAAGVAIPGATLTFMNPDINVLETVTTETETHRFKGLHGQTYDVLIAMDGYTFHQSQLSSGVLTDDTGIVFIGTKAATYSTISGTVSGAAGVQVTLTGPSDTKSQNVTKDGGTYAFTVFNGASYTVSAAKEGYSFNTADPINTISAAATRDFLASQTHVTISGKVTGTGNVAVLLSNGADISETITVEKSGESFTFTTSIPIGDTYSVTATKEGYTFTAVGFVLGDLNVATIDMMSFSINAHKVIPRVTISVQFDAPVTTDAIKVRLYSNISATNRDQILSEATEYDEWVDVGNEVSILPGNTYSFELLTSGINYWLVAVAPEGTTLINDTYGLPALTYSTSVKFEAIQYYAISGVLTDQFDAVIPGATVTLSGDDSQTATTGAGGDYTFDVLKDGDYVVTPRKLSYNFAPLTKAIESITQSIPANFFGTQYVTISGTVTDASTISGDVTVELSGGTQGTMTNTVAGGGSYNFVVKAGSNYRVIASKPGVTFAASSAGDFSDIRTNQTHNFKIQHTQGTGGNI